MTTASINYSALTEHRRVIKLWFMAIFVGLAIFCCLLVVSYFVLNAPSIADYANRYKRAESTLGFTELGGLALSAIALFRYLNVRSKYRKQVFEQFVKDNSWAHDKQYGDDKVPDMLLSAGESYEEGYTFAGNIGGHTFTCLLFQFVASDSQVRRYICMSFKLSKAYPLIVVGNKRNDHVFRQSEGDLPYQVPNGTELQLEGDFSDDFRVVTTKGDQKHALEVLTPDVMAMIQDYAADRIDVEIEDENMFIMCNADSYTDQNMRALFGLAEGMLPKFDHLSKSWMASSKREEKTIAKTAHDAHHNIIFSVDYVSLAIGLIVVIVGMALMISAMIETNNEPPSNYPQGYTQLP
jgi:hypothetical protein